MKNFLLFLSLALGATAFAAVEEPTHLRVVPVAGEPVVVAFDSKPELMFVPGGVQVVSEEASDPVSFDFEGIEHIDFVKPSGVSEAVVSEIRIAVTAAAIELSNLPADSVVDIYSLDGRRVFHAETSGYCSIDRSNLGKGVYVVKINKNVFKISI